MTRNATMVAAGLLASGLLLLAPRAASACEAHAQAARAKSEEAAKPAPEAAPAPEKARAPGGEVDRPLDALDSLMAAKCQCGSKADCTCKKGSCECSKCQKPKRQVMDALRGRPAELKLDEARRYDASAGIFI
ncbi:metallothionein [Myxococcus qinghaiensis]|uniref:metallothionein n=1 Tax=Myxococcus qinghaiensis TaxID=2906758 RepID=UPI0020A74F98|nr:metallothionein [Myxococcus qinghaiensis]MCP3163707.1 metallothionein [Myxococcus qinghaiensis]